MSKWRTDPPMDESNSKTILAQFANGTIVAKNVAFVANRWVSESYPDGAIAWMDCPEPYQPPKPKRQEWKLASNTKTDASELLDSDKPCGDITVFPSWGVFGVHVREVLDTDPGPDAVAEVVAEMRYLRQSYRTKGVVDVWLHTMDEWIDLLDPRTAADQARIDEGESV